VNIFFQFVISTSLCGVMNIKIFWLLFYRLLHCEFADITGGTFMTT